MIYTFEMKKIISTLVISFSLISCVPSFYENSPMTELGDLDQFFPSKRDILGASTVRLVSSNPVSISFIYQSTYVKDYQVANAAQFHCKKHGKNALEISDEVYNDPDWKIVFECK